MTPEQGFTLGPLPWSEETIERYWFAHLHGVWAAIREHPGFPPHRDIDALQQSLEILIDSVDELFTSIAAFDAAANVPTFWTRPARAQFVTHLRSIRRAMFAAVAAAVAWRDLVRVVGTHCVDAGHPLSDWDARWKALNLGEHVFLVGLRNCISHAGPVTPNWQRRIGFAALRTTATTRFLLSAETLAACDKLSAGAREYLKTIRDGVDLTVLFQTCMASIRSFHEWFSSSISKTFEPALGEYRSYETRLVRIRARHSWRLLLSFANRTNVDEFLANNLSLAELEEVRAFPAGSRERADRIIEILDEEDAVTPALRVQTYGVLGVPEAGAS